MTEVKFGNQVYTRDGKFLGSVTAVREGLMKLDAPMAVDFWLAENDVVKNEHGSVLMSFPEAELKDHRIESGAE
jgi:hypothetical protein